MEYLLFVVYLGFFAWLVTRTKFFLASGLSKPQLVILFLLKVIAGLFYGWIGIYYGQLAQMSDTWNYHYQSLEEFRILQENPHEYFTNIFHNPYERGLLGFFSPENSYWNDLKSNIFIKFISIFDIFTGGYYYVNVIFYSFAVFLGPVALFRVMDELFPGRRITVTLGIFFIPSFFYWGSGLGKEGLIFLAISLIIYAAYSASVNKQNRGQQLVFFISGLLLLLVLRNFVLMLILPALLAWFLANRYPGRVLRIYSLVYLAVILIFFTAKYISPHFDFPLAVVERQSAFNALTGQSSVPRAAMDPGFTAFLRHTPQALALSVTRPYPSDISHLLTLAAAVEIGLLLLMVVTSQVFRLPAGGGSRATVFFFFFFSVSLLLAIGFSVNNLGAIVRYRSIIMPLVLTPLLARTDWNRIARIAGGLIPGTR
ncbi:MAG: hypothetical protein EOO09_07450 [Chitinophagaceae bacterium]|nr:MAG: hypothetical protein EOO09_07450 [Chitinophagaceae bacterium]